MAEQDVKRRRVEGEEAKEEEKKEEAPPSELEKDEVTGGKKAAALKEKVGFQLCDCTLNVVPALGGRVLTPLTDGGLQYLVAGARANVGVKSGRYLFEARIVEMMASTEPATGTPRNAPMPRQVLKVGVVAEGAPLFLGETDASISFDSEGFTVCEQKRESNGKRIARGQTVGVLINLDPKSPNKNTVSLFLDGVRATQPVALPEAMVGKTLFPVVNFKNITVHTNFGSDPLAQLPFTCRTMQQMDSKDAVVAPGGGPGKDGKYEVLFPIGLPDEATFDWLDDFLAKNPTFCELSDRAIIKWAESSGMHRPSVNSWKNSNDKPDVHFNIPMMDDFSVRRVLNAVVATQPRNYVVMEVKANLVPSERGELMKKFNTPMYKKVAQVTMGEPAADFKKTILDELLKQKQDSVELAWKSRKAEKEREREREKIIKAQKLRMEEIRKEELNRRKEEALKAVADAGSEAQEGEVKKEDGDAETKGEDGDAKKEGEVKEEEVKKEEPKDEEMKQEVKEEEEEKEEAEEPMPVAELTEEEKKQNFRKKAVSDLTTWNLSSQIANFSLPIAEDGFDDVRFTWTKKAQAEEHFKAWLLRQKILCRMEDLTPGDWFKQRLADWQKVLAEWHLTHTEWNDPVKQAMRKAEAEHAKAKAEEEKKAAAAAVAAASAAEKKEGEGEGDKKEAEGEKKDGEEPEVEAKPEAEPKKEEAEKAEEKPTEPAEEDKKDFDIFTIENILDIGDGEPLFSQFTFEDWALLSLRLELSLMAHAFKKDAGDPDRVGIHESHLPFYYNKYFAKSFNVRYYGVEGNTDLIKLVKDSVSVKESGVLATELAEDFAFDTLVRRAEEDRRSRQHRLNAGDETARLNFNKPPEASSYDAPAHHGGYRGAGGGPRVGGGGYAPVHGSTLPPPPAPGQQFHSYGGGSKGAPYAGGGKGAPYAGGGGAGFRQSVCKQFQSHGNCRYGAACRFSHTAL